MPKRKWYEVKALAEGALQVSIHDEIGLWGVNAADFIAEINSHTNIAEIEVGIHSPGGSLFDGVAMFNALKNHSAKVVTRVDGIAASAASVVFLAGDERVMPEDTFLMIHNPWSGVMGDSTEMRKAADTLDQFQQMLVELYARETGIDEDAVAEMMKAETWLDASSAMDLDFATHLVQSMKVAALSKDFAKHFSEPPKALVDPISKDDIGEFQSLKELEQHLRDVGGYSNGAAKALVASAKQIIQRDAVNDEPAMEAINLLNTFKIGETK